MHNLNNFQEPRYQGSNLGVGQPLFDLSDSWIMYNCKIFESRKFCKNKYINKKKANKQKLPKWKRGMIRYLEAASGIFPNFLSEVISEKSYLRYFKRSLKVRRCFSHTKNGNGNHQLIWNVHNINCLTPTFEAIYTTCCTWNHCHERLQTLCFIPKLKIHSKETLKP